MTEPNIESLEPRLVYRQTELTELEAHHPLGELAVYSAVGPSKQVPNEDAALVFPLGLGRAVLAVADGVGGQPAGGEAARLALEGLRRALEQARDPAFPLREAVLSGIDQANAAVMALGGFSATTLSAVEIDGGYVRSYNVGDSGVLVLTSSGRVDLQTIPHSPVGYAIEAGVLDEADAMDHAQRHLVSNVIGDPGMHVEVSAALRLEPGHTVLVASDGLYDNLMTPEIVGLLRQEPFADAVRELIRECRTRMTEPGEQRIGKPDDLTLIAWRPQA